MASTIIPANKNSDYYKQIQDIFWETSARSDFENEVEKAEFEKRYLGIYLKDYSDLVFVAVNEERVLGYILGSPSTSDGKDILLANPHLEVFADMFDQYPAHLHINLRAETRGHGIGSELIATFEQSLRAKSVMGLHLITAPTARNVSFYIKNGFMHQVEKSWNGRPLLFLGKTLMA